MFKILIECLVAGILILLVGLILHVLLGHHALHQHSPKMREEMTRLSINLFLAGFLSWPIIRLTSLDKYIHK